MGGLIGIFWNAFRARSASKQRRFPRSIQLDIGPQGLDWGQIRSTMDLSRLVRFGVEAVFQITDGEKRVIVLIEMLSRQVKVAAPPGKVRKLAMN